MNCFPLLGTLELKLMNRDWIYEKYIEKDDFLVIFKLRYDIKLCTKNYIIKNDSYSPILD